MPVEAETDRWLAQGKLVGVVGGDHSVPFGAIRAIARKHPGLGVLHLDAHADLRDAYEGFTWSHASIMHNVAARIPDAKLVVLPTGGHFVPNLSMGAAIVQSLRR